MRNSSQIMSQGQFEVCWYVRNLIAEEFIKLLHH